MEGSGACACGSAPPRLRRDRCWGRVEVKVTGSAVERSCLKVAGRLRLLLMHGEYILFSKTTRLRLHWAACSQGLCLIRQVKLKKRRKKKD